jgi:hypothetical protein
LAGILKVDTLQSDSNLALKIATANVAFIDSNGLSVVGGNLTIGATQFAEGGQIQTSGIADDAITSDKILSVANTKISGNIVSSQIAPSQTFYGNTSLTGLLDLSSTNAGQIKFPASQNASSDANTLDDYEEGSWVPTIIGSGGSIGAQAYSVQAGRYVKIGRFVLLTGYLVLTNKGSWTGNATIGGFPFTVTNSSGSYSSHNFYYANITLPANNFSLGAFVNVGDTTAQVFSSNNLGTVNTDYSTIGNTTQLGPWQFCYYTTA